MGGRARNSCTNIDDEDDGACTYTSAAIPSKKNPLDFLSKRPHLQPRDQSRIVPEGTKVPLAAFADNLLFDSHSAGVKNRTDAAQTTQKYNSRSLCQRPYGSNCEGFACGVASDPFSFLLLVALIVLLESMFFDSFETREILKREKRAKKSPRRATEPYIKDIMVQHIEYAESPGTEAVHAKRMAGL